MNWLCDHGASTWPNAKRQYKGAWCAMSIRQHDAERIERERFQQPGGAKMASPKMFDLQGKVAVVTGGNGGIGRGIALGLAQAGASIVILARNEEKTRAVVKEIQALNVPVFAAPLDVTKRATLRPAMDEVEDKLGPIDI